MASKDELTRDFKIPDWIKGRKDKLSFCAGGIQGVSALAHRIKDEAIKRKLDMPTALAIVQLVMEVTDDIEKTGRAVNDND
jgi:hypothetical protein